MRVELLAKLRSILVRSFGIDFFRLLCLSLRITHVVREPEQVPPCLLLRLLLPHIPFRFRKQMPQLARDDTQALLLIFDFLRDSDLLEKVRPVEHEGVRRTGLMSKIMGKIILTILMICSDAGAVVSRHGGFRLRRIRR